MQLTLLKGYPDYVGKRFVFAGSGVGPAAYATGGDSLVFPAYEKYIDSIADTHSLSGTYIVSARPSVTGTSRATWKLVWFVAATGVEVAATTVLSAESVQIMGYGGDY